MPRARRTRSTAKPKPKRKPGRLSRSRTRKPVQKVVKPPTPKPLQILDILLEKGRKGCNWPAQMTAEDIQSPYHGFMFYRPLYLRYMLARELPDLGYVAGCHTLDDLKLTLYFNKEFTKLEDIEPTPVTFGNLFRSVVALEGDSCNLIVYNLEWYGWYEGKRTGHAMSLVFNLREKTAEYMEPNGPDTEWTAIVSDTVRTYLQSVPGLEDYSFREPLQVCPAKIQFKDYCAHYSLLYNWLRIVCNDCQPETIWRTFAKYTREENIVIINAFTCHMWQKMADIGVVTPALSAAKLEELKEEFESAGAVKRLLLLPRILTRMARIELAKPWAAEKVNKAIRKRED